MSKLLVDDHPLMFSPQFAKKVGLNGAILLQQIHYWLGKHHVIKEGRKWVYQSYKDWQKQLPFLSEKTIARTMLALEKEGYIFTATYNQHKMDRTKWYTINYEKVREFEKEVQMEKSSGQKPSVSETERHPQEDRLGVAIQETDKETKETKEIEIPFAAIIGYLNEKTESAFKATRPSTKRLIRARWQEGFRLDDFKKVIDIKTAEWLYDARMKKYLRPETLFSPKFESYRNQQPVKKKLSMEDFDLDDET